MKSHCGIAVRLLVVSLIAVCCSGQQCSFEYLAQPPSTTVKDCSPFDEDEKINIELVCFVRRLQSDQFMIKWFRENTTGAVEDLGLGDPVVQHGIARYSRYHSTAFFNQPYSPSLLGKYWCQVINTTADPDQPLMRSNVFTLLAPGDYSEPSCISKNLKFQYRTSADLKPIVQQDTRATMIVAVSVPGGVIMIICVATVTIVLAALFLKRRKNRNTTNKKNHSQARDHQTALHDIESEQNFAMVLMERPKQGQHTNNEAEAYYITPISAPNDAVQYTSIDSPAAHYQPLDTATTDYTSLYTTPTGRRGPPSVEVEGKIYSIVDPTKRETDTTYDSAPQR